MKYIIIIDNNKQNGRILQGILQQQKQNQNTDDYKIGSWSDLSSDIIDQEAEKLCIELKKIFTEQDNLHLIIDLLLTKYEEDNVENIADKLLSRDTDHMTASGIKLANKILECLDHSNRIHISFMSKWLNLQNDFSMGSYNGIFENPLWKNRKAQSVFNPISENHCIINRTLSVPKYGAKTAVDALINMAFMF